MTCRLMIVLQFFFCSFRSNICVVGLWWWIFRLERAKKAYLAEARPQARLSVFASIRKIHLFSIGVLLVVGGGRVWIDCFHGMSHGRYLLLYAALIGAERIQKYSDHVVDSKVSLYRSTFVLFVHINQGVAGVVRFFMAPYKSLSGFARRMNCAFCAIAAVKVIKLESECGVTNKCICAHGGLMNEL